jgi:small GTP-binding protein
MIGDASVGKTCMLTQLTEHKFSAMEVGTVSANYQLYLEEIDGLRIEIQIWDTAGQEKFRSLGPIYYRNALGAVAVFDVTNRSSFDNLPEWISSFTDVTGKGPVIVVVGNKCDLSHRFQVTREEAAQWAAGKGLAAHFTSARTGEGIRELFQSLARRLMQVRLAHSRSHGEEMAGRSDRRPCNCWRLTE